MWPRRNRADKPGSAATPPTGAAVPRLVREPGWEALPPLGSTAPTVQLAIATDRFEAELPSRQSTRFLGPLGHDVSADGPIGVISGVLEPAGPPRTGDGPGINLAVPGGPPGPQPGGTGLTGAAGP